MIDEESCFTICVSSFKFRILDRAIDAKWKRLGLWHDERSRNQTGKDLDVSRMEQTEATDRESKKSFHFILFTNHQKSHAKWFQRHMSALHLFRRFVVWCRNPKIRPAKKENFAGLIMRIFFCWKCAGDAVQSRTS